MIEREVRKLGVRNWGWRVKIAQPAAATVAYVCQKVCKKYIASLNTMEI